MSTQTKPFPSRGKGWDGVKAGCLAASADGLRRTSSAKPFALYSEPHCPHPIPRPLPPRGEGGRVRLLRFLLVPAALICIAAAEPAPAPDRPLPDAAQEARAQALFDDIRCVVCQHEAIADSPAGIAADMRGLVREQIAAGRTDEQVRDDLVRRYGDFVLFTPPLRGGTWLLWFGPLAALLAAGAGLWFAARRRPTGTEPLSAAEEADLARILADQAVRPDPDAKPTDD